jgi:hypothetical protein
VIVITGYRKIGSSSSWGISGNPDLYFEYVSSSEKEELTALELLHLRNISLPYPAIYALMVRESAGEFARTVIFNKDQSTGCAFSVPDVGNYSISFESVSPGVVGLLHFDGNVLFSVNESGDNIYDTVDFILSPTPSVTRTPTLSATPTAVFSESNPEGYRESRGFDESERLRESRSVEGSQRFPESRGFSASSTRTDLFTLPANVYRIRRRVRTLYLFTAVLPDWGNSPFFGF